MEFLFDNLSFFVKLGVFSAIITIILTIARSKEKRRYAPGPVCLPFVGYLPYIFSDAPRNVVAKLQAKYGNIFGMYVGFRYCVFINDFKSTKEAFNDKSLVERPPNYTPTSPKALNFMEMDYVNWKDHYQFVRNHWLRNTVLGGNRLKEIIQDELSRVIPRFEAQVGKPRFNLRQALHCSLSNTAFQTICGHWFEDDHPMMTTFLTFQHRLLESFTNNTAKIYFPWLVGLQARFDPRTRKVIESASELEKFIRAEVEARVLYHNDACENDYIDLFLTEMKKREKLGEKTSFNIDVLVSNCMVLLLASADTVRNVVEFCLMAMAKYPDVQRRVHEELDSVLGSDRAPTLSDKGQLVYTEATIHEVQRWKTLTPINLLRMAAEDTSIQGYHVPKGSLVMQNMGFLDRDADLWSDPESFKPERFLSKDLKKVVTPEHFMPFSTGKRTCPGDKMAQTTLFLYFATLMQKFNISEPEGGINTEIVERINACASQPIVRITRRQLD